MKVLTVDKLSRVGSCGVLSVVLAGFLCQLGVSFSPTFLTLWGTTAASYLILAALKLSASGKTVLITGCDSGFGHALALHLDALGFVVVACCLNVEGEGAQRLRNKGSARLQILQLDITHQDQINSVITHLKAMLGSQGSLWGLVNNAGINAYGAVEWVSLAQYRRIFNVNLMGTLAVTKAALPLIRKAKGRVVTVGSIRGRFAEPLGSIYDTSKFALEALNDCLRQEMKAFGVKVSLIEPGNYTAGTKVFQADFLRRFGEKMWAEMDEEVKSAYGKDYYDDLLRKQIQKSNTGDTDVTEVVEVITEALLQWFPQSRYQPMGLDAKVYFINFVNTHLPEWFYDLAFDQLVTNSGW